MALLVIIGCDVVGVRRCGSYKPLMQDYARIEYAKSLDAKKSLDSKKVLVGFTDYLLLG